MVVLSCFILYFVLLFRGILLRFNLKCPFCYILGFIYSNLWKSKAVAGVLRMQRTSDAYYSAERSFADKFKTLCLRSITRAVNFMTLCDTSLPLWRLCILKKWKRIDIIFANSVSHTAGRNHYRFWVNLNPKLFERICDKPVVLVKVRYIVSLVALYFTDLEVHFYLCSKLPISPIM